MRHIAGYHLGWCDADGTVVDASGGKAIRPALTLLSAEAVGGDVEHAVPAAVAVELVHNFSLLHDDVLDGDVLDGDVLDGDDTRRHRLTAWRAFGVGNAILAGDALLALALEVVGDVGPLARSEVAAVVAALAAGSPAGDELAAWFDCAAEPTARPEVRAIRTRPLRAASAA